MKECHNCIYAEKCTPFEKNQDDECDDFLDSHDLEVDEDLNGDSIWYEMSWYRYTQTLWD